MSKLSPTELYLLNAKPTADELARMVAKLQGEGYYAENLNKDGVIVKGANWVIKREGHGDKYYAEGFQENRAWMQFLGWSNHWEVTP
jgi:hypothetical protein